MLTRKRSRNSHNRGEKYPKMRSTFRGSPSLLRRVSYSHVTPSIDSGAALSIVVVASNTIASTPAFSVCHLSFAVNATTGSLIVPDEMPD